MKKSIALLAFIFLVGSSTFRSGAAIDETGITNSPTLSYAVKAGEEFQYDLHFNISYGFENSSVIDTVNIWAEEHAGEEIDYHLTNTLQALANFTELVNQDVQIKLRLHNIYSQWHNFSEWWEDGWNYTSWDVFNGSIQMRENQNTPWITPGELAAVRLLFLQEFAINTLQIAPNDDILKWGIDFLNDTIQDEALDWSAMDLCRLQAISNKFYENGTQIPSEVEYRDGEPRPPIDDFAPDSFPIFLPSNFDFGQWADYLEEAMNYDIAHGNIDDQKFDSYEDSLGASGISSLFANTHGLGIVMNTAAINETFITQISDGQVNLSDLLEGLGFQEWNGLAHCAIEYGSDFALSSFAAYIDISGEMDTLSLISEGVEAPYIHNEIFSLQITFTLVRDGISPPSREQIASGKIGDIRILDSSQDNFFANIPGMAFPFLVGLGLCSIGGLLKAQKNKLKH